MDELDDERIVRELLQGNRRAADVFVRRVQHAIMRSLRGFRQFSASDIEELFQDVFERIFANDCDVLARWRGEGSVAAYVATIARNLARDRLRARSDHDPEPLDDPDALVGDAADPEAIARVNELRRMMRVAIQQLGPPHEQVLTLVELEEMSYAEAGQRLDRSANYIGVQLHQAKRALRALIERDFPELRFTLDLLA